VPLNFLNPRPGTPYAGRLSSLAPTRCGQSRRSGLRSEDDLRYAGGRELTLGELDVAGMLGGINAVIVGNYLTTLGRPPQPHRDAHRPRHAVEGAVANDVSGV